jgi:branched-chain amino acid transport system permease protein
VFVIAAGFAGFAGALLAYYNGVVAPGLYSFDQSMAIIVMVVIGGSGNFYGSLIGAAFVVGANPFFDKVVHLNPEKGSLARLLAYGVALVLVLRWRPQGILPEGVTPRMLLRRLRPADRGREPAPRVDRPAPPVTAEHTDDGVPVALEAVRLTKSFGGIHAVKDLSFALERGRITGLIGPNGAGKTTVFNLLTGAIKPDGGEVFLNGAEVTGQPVHRLARAGIVRSFQGVRIYPKLTALENVMMGVRGQRGERLARVLTPVPLGPGERRTRERAMEHLGFVGLDGQATKPAGAMAFGEQKLVALARVLATEAEVLLLDEPASGIDKRWVDRMVELIAQLPGAGFTVCIVEHNLNFIDRLAQKICFMQDGAVRSEGTMAELREQEGLQEVYFGTAL